MPKGIYIRKPNTRNGKYIRTPEILKKMSESHKGKKLSEEHKRNISLSNMGRLVSKVTRRKIGEKNKISLRGHIPWSKGKKFTEEHKRKLRLARVKQVTPFHDTSIEIKLQEWLKEQNIEFQKHYPILGQPDILIKPNIAIFADGCYWHKCPECGFGELRQRDKEVTEELQKQGYIVIRLWEHEINKNQFSGLNQLIN